MSLVILRDVQVQNANATSVACFGFPAITNFCGYVHALSRKLSESHGISFKGCAVVAHDFQVLAYQADNFSDYEFALAKSPANKKGLPPPITPEGRMHLTVSLVIDSSEIDISDADAAKGLADYIKDIAIVHKLAGGRIMTISQCDIYPKPHDRDSLRRIMRSLLPGFVLTDRSSCLPKHLSDMQEGAQMVDAWLDYCALKFAPEIEKEDQVAWKHVPKPDPGYLVPVMIGYKGISEVYQAGEVANTRCIKTPFRFVEPVFSIAEWLSPGRVERLEDIVWQHCYENPYYVCQAGR